MYHFTLFGKFDQRILSLTNAFFPLTISNSAKKNLPAAVHSNLKYSAVKLVQK
jgi:hypothetical protein